MTGKGIECHFIPANELPKVTEVPWLESLDDTSIFRTSTGDEFEFETAEEAQRFALSAYAVAVHMRAKQGPARVDVADSSHPTELALVLETHAARVKESDASYLEGCEGCDWFEAAEAQAYYHGDWGKFFEHQAAMVRQHIQEAIS